MAMNPATNSEATDVEGNGAASVAMAPQKPKWSKVKSAGAAQSPWLGALMFAPAVLYLALIIGGPFVLAVLYAFSDVRIGSTGMHYVGLENFRSIIQSPSFITSLKNSFIFTFFSQVIVILGSTILAVALEKKFRGRGLVRFLILLPWVAPISLGAMGWKWILDSLYSVINWVLVAVHLYKPFSAPIWLGEPHLAMASVILVQSWRLLPFSTVIMLAGLSAIPKEIPEAEAIDGAGFWRTLFQVNIPMMLPIINVAVLFGIIFTFTDMTVVYILTAGGPFDSTQVLPSYAYLTGIQGSDLAAGSAVSLFLVPLLVAIAYFMLRVAHRAEVV
jgi:multiple sugar transport system permease protein